MKKLFLKSAILLLPCFILPMLPIMSRTSPDNFFFALMDKHDYMAKITGKKIVLAGGSNAAFGIDSDKIEKELNIPVVNVGLHAAIGIARILDDISQYLNSGDILIITPEYHNFNSNWNGGKEAYYYIIDVRQYQLLLNPPYYMAPPGFFEYYQERIINFLPGFKIQDSSRYSFNKFGDYANHLKDPIQCHSHEVLVSIGAINYSDIVKFEKIIDDFTDRGIKVLLSYPAYEEESFINSIDSIHELDEILREIKNLTVISSPENYKFTSEYIFDSAYHLNASGREKRTAQLIEDLQEALIHF
jgi:hypothetical protein